MVDGHRSEEDQEGCCTKDGEEVDGKDAAGMEREECRAGLSAASCIVLTFSDYCKLGKPEMKNSKTVLAMYDGSTRKSCGFCQLWVRDKLGRVHQLRFEVLRTRHCSLLSLDTSLMLELITYTVWYGSNLCIGGRQRITKDGLLGKFLDVFSGVGCLPAVEAKLRSLEKSGMISRVDTPTEWISNPTAVWKSDKQQMVATDGSGYLLEFRQLQKNFRNDFRGHCMD
eukprot:Em0116g1a